MMIIEFNYDFKNLDILPYININMSDNRTYENIDINIGWLFFEIVIGL